MSTDIFAGIVIEAPNAPDLDYDEKGEQLRRQQANLLRQKIWRDSKPKLSHDESYNYGWPVDCQ
jgi:hypothetical protein